MTYNETFVNLAASATAGAISRLVCHPVDTCKAKLQSSTSFKGTSDVFRKTLRNEGISGLYKGINAALFGGIPGVCLYIMTYETCKQYCEQQESLKKLPLLAYFGSGMIAETICCTVFVPVDVIKERLQVQSNQTHSVQYKGSIDALKTILKQEGLTGLYKGYGATLFSYGPFSAFYFLFFEEAKKLTRVAQQRRRRQSETADTTSDSHNTNTDTLPFMDNLVCSAAAGSAASYITNPLDLAKLRYQVQRGGGGATAASSSSVTTTTITTTATAATAVNMQAYTGLFDALSKIYKSSGLKGLFRGAWTRVLFHTPATAITMAVYEECKAQWMNA